MAIIKPGSWANVLFMMVALCSLIYSSWRMQPCTCPLAHDSEAGIGGLHHRVGIDVVTASTAAGGRTIRVDLGPNDNQVRRIRLPRKVDRGAFSGSYWSHGSWGRVLRTSSGCWAYPAQDSHAMECYHRLVSRHAEVFLDVEQLASLRAVEVVVTPSLVGTAAATIGERMEPNKRTAERPLVGNTTLGRLPTVYQRYHVPSSACQLGTGTFNFSCVIRLNVRYDTVTPKAPPPEVCFISLGDWGEARRAQREVANMIADIAEYRMAKFVMSTGDNFYPAGVQSTADPQWINTFETPYAAQSLTNVRWYISLGNHDQWGYMAQKQYYEDHPRWYLPEYSYQDSVPLYRDARKASNETIELAVMNSAGRELPAQIQEADKFYLSQEARHGVSDASRHWRFVTNHEPVYSGGLHGLIPERNEYVRGNLQPMLRQHMVHAYFNGDDHFLEVHRNLGTDYFTSGGGAGSDVYGSTLRPTTKWNMFTDYIPKDAPPGVEVVIDGTSKKASARGAMLHCVDGGDMTTYILDERGSVMHVYHTPYDVDPQEFGLEIEDHG